MVARTRRVRGRLTVGGSGLTERRRCVRRVRAADGDQRERRRCSGAVGVEDRRKRKRAAATGRDVEPRRAGGGLGSRGPQTLAHAHARADDASGEGGVDHAGRAASSCVG